MSLILKSLQVYQLGTYEPQYARPMTVQASEEDMLNLRLLLQDRQSLHGVVSDPNWWVLSHRLCQLGEFQSAHAALANGWDTARLGFTLQLQNTFAPTGAEQIQVVQGYTDYLGYSRSKNQLVLDPQMRFTVNMVQNFRHMDWDSPPVGLQHQTAPQSSLRVLSNFNFGGLYGGGQLHGCRAQDVFSAMSALNLPIEGSLIDTRTMSTTAPMFSSLSQSVPAVWLHGMLHNYRDAVLNHMDILQGIEDLSQHLRGVVAEPSTFRDPFLQTMSRLQQGHVSSTFTWGELQELFTDLPDRGMMLPTPVRLHRAGEGAMWDNNELTTQVAALLAQALPAAMGRLGLSHLRGSLSNTGADRVDAEMKAQINGYDFHLPQAGRSSRMEQYVLASMQRVCHALMPLTHYNAVPLQLEFEVIAGTEARFKLSLNQQEAQLFAVPLFADALFTPLLCSDAHLRATAEQVQQLLSALEY